MKDITKVEPSFYSDFIKKDKPSNWEETAPIRGELRQYMLANEQQNQCAYTEVILVEGLESTHIDHFKRRHYFPNLTLEYTNLFAAYKHQEYGAGYKDKTVSKDDFDNILHPHFDDVEGRFRYIPFTGKIISAKENDIKADFTIKAFNLNSAKLQQRRRVTASLAIQAFEAAQPIEETIAQLGEFESLVRYIYS